MLLGLLFFPLSTENKKKKDLVEMMVRRGYDSDPVKAWKDAQNKGKVRTCTGQYSSSLLDCRLVWLLRDMNRR